MGKQVKQWIRDYEKHWKAPFMVCWVCGGDRMVERAHLVAVHEARQLKNRPENSVCLCRRCHETFDKSCGVMGNHRLGKREREQLAKYSGEFETLRRQRDLLLKELGKGKT